MYDIKNFENSVEFVEKAITAFSSSKERRRMITARNYAEGRNETIEAVKKLICVKNDKGKFVQKNNPYVSNYKIKSDFVRDMIDQKVFTLLDKSPSVEGISDDVQKAIKTSFDYALQEMATEASLCGVAFAYAEYQGLNMPIEFKVFTTENCIPFYDLYTKQLKALIRFYNNVDAMSDSTTSYAEVFDQSGVTVYEKGEKDSKYNMVSQKPYITMIVGNAISTERQPKGWESGLPIIEFCNNSQRTSDFNNDIRSKIDARDIVNSDFANNLSDFQEIFWIIKGLDGVSAEEMGSFIETIKAEYKASLPEGADASPTTIEVPYEAKIAFLDHINKELINDAGVLDSSMLLSAGLTTVAIQMASRKLNIRVSKFEYYAYMAAMRMLAFVTENANASMEKVDVKFKKGGLVNDTEVITNLLTSSSMLSQKTILENHPYVENVDEELERIEEESMSAFKLEEPTEQTEPQGEGGAVIE